MLGVKARASCMPGECSTTEYTQCSKGIIISYQHFKIWRMYMKKIRISVLFFFLKSENLSVSLQCNHKLVIPGDATVTTAPFDTATLRLHTHFSHL